MPYNQALADRIRFALNKLPDVQEKKMFGKLAFMVNEKMCVTVGLDRIMCRIDPEQHQLAIAKKGIRPVFMRGREYKGYIYIQEQVIKNDSEFDYWIDQALRYNASLNAAVERK